MIYQIEQWYRYSVFRTSRFAKHKIIWCVMTEHQASCAPVTDFLRTWKDSFWHQIIKSSCPVVVTFPSCHTMSRIIALISFVTGEHIQICSVQMNLVLFQFTKITLYIMWSLCCTQIWLLPACPSLMCRNCSVRQSAGIVFVKTFCQLCGSHQARKAPGSYDPEISWGPGPEIPAP